MALVRRASLGALWAREPNTVAANLREGVWMEKFTSRLNLPCVTLAMGPFLLGFGDSWIRIVRRTEDVLDREQGDILLTDVLREILGS